jgi:hypothetical protein
LHKRIYRGNYIVACEEPIITDTETYPESGFWTKGIQLYRTASEKRGTDCDYGLRLPVEMEEVGLSIKTGSFAQALMTKEHMRDYMRQVIVELKTAFVDGGLMSEEQHEELLGDVESDRYDCVQYSTFHRIAQFAGR